MNKKLREKLIRLNGQKVNLTTKWGQFTGTLKISFERYQNDNFLRPSKMTVGCGTYNGYPLGHNLNSIIDVEPL